jgi:crotonobetainyl-CoA:carnitine CoA-transferase CaiB-like acyl-CoA transferase
VFLAALTQHDWEVLVVALGRDELAADERFATDAARREHDDALIDELASVLATRDALHWEYALSALGIGCAATASTPLQGFTSLDLGLRASGLTVAVEHPTLGTLVRSGPPATFSATPAVVAPGTIHGQNTVAVLHELGYDDATIDDLVARGIAYRAEEHTR